MQRTKNWKKTGLKQGIKTKEGKSKRCCCRQSTWLIIALLSHRYRSAIAPISLRYHSIVAPLSHCYRTAIVPPLSLRCPAAVVPLSYRYRSTVALLLSLLLPLRSHTAITPVLLHCRSGVVPGPDGTIYLVDINETHYWGSF